MKRSRKVTGVLAELTLGTKPNSFVIYISTLKVQLSNRSGKAYLIVQYVVCGAIS